MFSFFSILPNEIIESEIFNRFYRKDLSGLAVVDKRFHELSKTELSKIVHSIGDTSLVIQKELDEEKSFSPFYLYIMKEKKLVLNTAILIFRKDFEIIFNAMKKGTLTLIKELKSDKSVSSKFYKNALLIEEAFNKEKVNDVSLKPKP